MSSEALLNLDSIGDVNRNFRSDWVEIRNNSDVLSGEPDEYLLDEEINAIFDSYETSRESGRQHLLRLIKEKLQDRAAAMQNEADTLRKSTMQYELESEERQKVLKLKAKERSVDSVCINIEVVRQYMNINYQEMGNILGVSRSSVYKIHKEKRGTSIQTIMQFSIGLGIPAEIILVDDNQLISWGEDVILPESNDEWMARNPEEWRKSMASVVESVGPQTTGGILSAAIGCHRGQKAGAKVLAEKADKEYHNIKQEIENFLFPGKFVSHRAQNPLKS